jgi:hypothetical protein
VVLSNRKSPCNLEEVSEEKEVKPDFTQLLSTFLVETVGMSTYSNSFPNDVATTIISKPLGKSDITWDWSLPWDTTQEV